MTRLAPLAVLLALAAAPAVAQAPLGPVAAILARASICAPGPDFDAIAGRAPLWGWTELPRKEALKLQALPNKDALIRAWTVGGAQAPAFLVVETTQGPRPRRLACEVLFVEPGGGAVGAALAERGFNEQPLRAPRLQGVLPAGGRFTEWAAPEGGGWRLITYSAPLPPKKGLHLSRIRFSGVEP